MNQILSFFQNLALSLLLVPPQIFVFSLTLLGNALETSEQEEKSARENEIAEIFDKIATLTKTTKQAKKTRDTSKIAEELNVLIIKQKVAEKRIGEIRSKYKRIHFNNLILIPSICFITIALINSLPPLFTGESVYFSIGTIAVDVVLFFVGLKKVYLALELVQEISINKKDSQMFSKLRDTVVSALQQSKAEDKPLAYIEFEDVKFPLSVGASEERLLKFYIGLKRGTGLDNVDVWFMFPEGFELLDPDESKMWRQSASSFAPNYKTVKIGLRNLVPNVKNAGTIRFKVPANPGNYTVYYSVVARNYSGGNEEIIFIVNK